MSDTRVFVIAECGSCWRFGDDHLANAYRGIAAAKEAGADCVKFQWTSDGQAMAVRRSGVKHEYDQGSCGEDQCPTCLQGEMYERYLQYPVAWLPLLKAKCDAVGIEFMCTVFLPQDIAVIAPLVKRFKVAAKESDDRKFIKEHKKHGKEIIASTYGDDCIAETIGDSEQIKTLLCVGEYPCPLEHLKLGRMLPQEDTITGLYIPFDGLSDHTGHVLTGAVAVGAGAKVIESHVRLNATPRENPDFGHSLNLERFDAVDEPMSDYGEYVSNIREASRMM